MPKFALALLSTLMIAPVGFAQQSGAWADKLFGGEVSHDFGTVAHGSQLKFSFKLTNIYAVPLDVTNIRVSCSCVRAEAGITTLQPGQSGTVNINMDSKQFVGSRTVRIYVTVGPKHVGTAVLTVSAIARGDVLFTPTEIEFGSFQRGQSPVKEMDIVYTGRQRDFRVTEIINNRSAPFDLKTEELPRLANGLPQRGFRLIATIKADASAGAFRQEVVLKTNEASGPVLTVNVSGNVQASLAVSPGSIAIKDLKVGESETKKVFVRAARPFRILGVDGQGDGITVETPNRQEMTHIITVIIEGKKEGEYRRQLLIRTDLDNETTPLTVEANITPADGDLIPVER